jgi:hypothetical protein
VLLREEGVSFQKVKTWKRSKDPEYAAEKARIEHLYAIAGGEVVPDPDEPQVIFCLDEFGPVNVQPHPGRQWAERGGKHKDPNREPRRRRRASYTRPHGAEASVRRVRPDHRPVLRARRDHQDKDDVSRVLPVSAHPVSGRGPYRDRV